MHRLYENYRRITRRNLQLVFHKEIYELEREIRSNVSLKSIETFSTKQKLGLFLIIIGVGKLTKW